MPSEIRCAHDTLSIGTGRVIESLRNGLKNPKLECQRYRRPDSIGQRRGQPFNGIRTAYLSTLLKLTTQTHGFESQLPAP